MYNHKEYQKEYHRIYKVDRTEYLKKYRLDHYNEIKEKNKEYRKLHRIEIIEKSKKYTQEHQKELKEYREIHKEERKNYDKEYFLNNKEEIVRKKIIYTRNKRKTDLNFRLRDYLRNRIYYALKENSKSAKTMELLGCSIEFFLNYYESKFINGMSWTKVGNGEIHCDHIIPCASFDLSKPEEQHKCFHYTNLQPLWARDNLIKSDTIN